MFEELNPQTCREQLMAIGFKHRVKPSRWQYSEDVELDANLRRFFEICGGLEGEAYLPMTDPTPFGDPTLLRIYSLNESLYTSQYTYGFPKEMIPIAEGDFLIYCVELAASSPIGRVYVIDTDGTDHFDADALLEIPTLDEKVREYFELKKKGQLPMKPE